MGAWRMVERPDVAGPPRRIIGPGGKPAWAVSRNADVRAVLSCPFASSDPSRPGFPEPEDLEGRTPFLIELDAPRHAQLRRLVLPEFGMRSVAALVPRLRACAQDLADRMCAAAPDADLAEGFARPMASLAICLLLDVPVSDGPLLTRLALTLADDSLGAEARGTAYGEVCAYMEALIADRIAHPSNDLFGRLAGGPLAQGQITREELVSLAILLLMAGHDTSAKMVVLGVETLLDHPEARTRIVTGDKDAYAAVDELVRLHSIGDDDAFRVATADIAVGGITIPPGEGIIPLLRLANHDPALFDQPERFDLDRNTHAHLGFGYGPHLCLGRPLARAVLAVSYQALFASIPGLKRCGGQSSLRLTGWSNREMSDR